MIGICDFSFAWLYAEVLFVRIRNKKMGKRLKTHRRAYVLCMPGECQKDVPLGAFHSCRFVAPPSWV